MTTEGHKEGRKERRNTPTSLLQSIYLSALPFISQTQSRAGGQGSLWMQSVGSASGVQSEGERWECGMASPHSHWHFLRNF